MCIEIVGLLDICHGIVVWVYRGIRLAVCLHPAAAQVINSTGMQRDHPQTFKYLS